MGGWGVGDYGGVDGKLYVCEDVRCSPEAVALVAVCDPCLFVITAALCYDLWM